MWNIFSKKNKPTSIPSNVVGIFTNKTGTHTVTSTGQTITISGGFANSTTSTTTHSGLKVGDGLMSHIAGLGKKIYCGLVVSDDRPSFYKRRVDHPANQQVYNSQRDAVFRLHVGYTEDDFREFIADLDFHINSYQLPRASEAWASGTVWYEDMTCSRINSYGRDYGWVYYGAPEIPTELWRDTDKEARKKWRNDGQK